MGSGRSCGRYLDGLHLQLDVDAIADEDAAGLEQLVPVQAEVLPVEGRRRRESETFVAPWILRAAAVLDVERHLARDVADRQVPDDAKALPRDLFDSRGPESQL